MTTAPAASTNPFAGIPISDWVRDGAAALLLLVSLALPWSYGFGFGSSQVGATGRIEVILVTLLSLFSLAITYLARGGVFPSSVTVRTVWVLRLAANAPYVLVVLVHIALDALSAQGLGFAAAFGLAGALLAAQPREAEVRGLPYRDPIAGIWYAIAVGFSALGALTALLSLVFGLTGLGRFGGLPVVLAVIIGVLLAAAAVLVPALGLIRRSEAWRTVIVGLGASLSLVVLIDAATGYALSPLGVESLHAVGYLVVLFLPLAAIAASPGTRLAMTPMADLTRWFTAAATTLVIGAVLAGASVLGAIATLLAVGAGSSITGPTVISTILLVVILVAALIGRSFLRSNPAGSRWMVPGFAGAILLLGLITAAVSSLSGAAGVPLLVLALGVPGVIAFALLAPQSVRQYFATAAPVATSSSYLAAVDPNAAVIEPAPVAVVNPLLQKASDPATAPAELQALAAAHEELWPAIAANPAAYDALLEWLGNSDNPQVQAALRARGR